jgi:delta8-fatty-acid desaturase
MHTQATLQTMNRYRIGRIEGQWKNMTPPIQGGVYHVQEEEDADSSSDNASVVTDEDKQDSGIDCDTASDTSSIDLSFKDKEGPYLRLPHSQKNMIERIDSAVDVASKDPTTTARLRTPAEYVANTVQEEIDADIAKYPSLDFDTQRDIALKFEALHTRVKAEGFYECRYTEYGKEMVRYSALFAMFVFTLKKEWYFVSACFLGLFWHQIMFTAHDAGHRGITKNITKDTLIGIFIADFCCGLSIGWWKSSHNVHHLLTNAPVSTFPHSTPKVSIPRLNSKLTSSSAGT